jgi:predicted small lipoprotein YifL
MPTDNSNVFDAANLSDKAKASLDAPTMTSLFKPFTLIALLFTLAACAGGGSGPGSLAYVANKSGNNTNPVYDYNDDTNPVYDYNDDTNPVYDYNDDTNPMYDFSDVDTRDATDGAGQGFGPRSIATTRTLQ